jgi:hypothetical protein
MFISRRKFLQAGAVMAIAAGVPLTTDLVATKGQSSSAPQPSSPGEAAPASPAVKSDTPSLYTKAAFTAYLNTSFRIRSKSTRAVEVKLVTIKDAGPIPDRMMAGKECFSLQFRGPLKLQQDVYTIEHAALGKFDLLLVPVGKDKKGMYYEALINRLN